MLGSPVQVRMEAPSVVPRKGWFRKKPAFLFSGHADFTPFWKRKLPLPWSMNSIEKRPKDSYANIHERGDGYLVRILPGWSPQAFRE